MTKYITIAALLAAGTSAFAVENLKALDDELLKLSNVTLGNSGSSTITSGNNSLSFNVDNQTSLTNYTLTFGYNAYPAEGLNDPWLRLVENTYGIKTTSSGTMVLCNSDWQDNISGAELAINTTDTFALTLFAGKAYLSNLTTGVYVSGTPDAIDKWGITTGSRVYTNSTVHKITLGQVADLTGLTEAQALQVVTSGTYTPVPEPSAFGLLAGIGALALVASRRRRK